MLSNRAYQSQVLHSDLSLDILEELIKISQDPACKRILLNLSKISEIFYNKQNLIMKKFAVLNLLRQVYP